MIITKLNGGLGNQLFEYACARNLQLKCGDEMWLDIEGFRRSPRHYSLDNFVLCDEVKLLPETESRSLVILQGLSKLNSNLAHLVGSLFGVYIWKSSNFKPLTVKDTKGKTLYLYGYWQSESYFKEHAEQIVSELRVKTPIPEKYQKLAEEICKTNSVCVHIRRGDYVDCGFLHCDEKYYNRGLEYILKKHVDCNVFVFSDDINWVKGNMEFICPVTYVDSDIADFETLRLMYLCKHFVISNSSFSWWAQYISENPNKIVVAPEYWLPGNKENKSMYLDSWVVL